MSFLPNSWQCVVVRSVTHNTLAKYYGQKKNRLYKKCVSAAASIDADFPSESHTRHTRNKKKETYKYVQKKINRGKCRFQTVAYFIWNYVLQIGMYVWINAICHGTYYINNLIWFHVVYGSATGYGCFWLYTLYVSLFFICIHIRPIYYYIGKSCIKEREFSKNFDVYNMYYFMYIVARRENSFFGKLHSHWWHVRKIMFAACFAYIFRW